jgi:hypothetical protein
MQEQLKFWQGTNFWIALVLALGGLFVGFPEGDARNIVGAIFALVASAGAIREKIKGAKIDWKAWISSKNTWNYIAAAVTAAVPMIPLDLFARLNDLATSAISGNWQGIVTALFSIATIIYYIFRKPGQPATTGTAKKNDK